MLPGADSCQWYPAGLTTKSGWLSILDVYMSGRSGVATLLKSLVKRFRGSQKVSPLVRDSSTRFDPVAQVEAGVLVVLGECLLAPSEGCLELRSFQ